METIHTVTAVVGALVGLVGFAAVVYQLRQVERGLRGAGRSSIYDMAARLKQVFVDDPELRPYFFDGRELEESDPKYGKVVAAADFYCLYLEQIATQSGVIGSENRKQWLAYAAGIYARSPVLRNYLADKQSWYSPAFWRAMRDESADQTKNTRE